MNLHRILLVDDSVRDTELAIDALRRHHLANEVVTLRDGAEALDYLHCRSAFAERPRENPAFVLLDLKMPKVDGLEVLSHIRGDPALRLIPVVIMTSSREERDVLESYQRGVNAYIVKPLDFAQFSKVVAQVGAFWAVLNEPPPGPNGRRLADESHPNGEAIP